MLEPIRRLILVLSLGFAAYIPAHAQIVRVDPGDFKPDAGLITFSEFSIGTINPTYAPTDYGGGSTSPAVSFAGYFAGQSLGDSACPGANTGCVVGLPAGPLALDLNSPTTFITVDGANPTSPVLSGSPVFNGPVSILFDIDVAGVGLDGGFFDAIGGTAISAFARDGSFLGSITNTALGIEFLGLVTADGKDHIAGLQFSLVGPEPFGFGIDNLRFGLEGQVEVPVVPEPESYMLLVTGLVCLAFVKRFRLAQLKV